MKFFFPTLLLAALFLGGCKKDEAPAPVDNTPATSLTVSFRNMIDNDPLVLGGPNRYLNAHGDSFYVTIYNYYISNVKLTGPNGTWSEPESYHLLQAFDPSSLSFTMHGMPEGTYTGIQFMIGVDSVRNVSGAQTGALDPANGMFWTWSTGYIMAKFEGKSPQSTAPSHNLTFHVGGYGGNRATQRTVSPSFGALAANVSTTVTPVIHIDNNVNEWFRSPVTIDFSQMNAVASSGADALMIADNYLDMFTVTGIDN